MSILGDIFGSSSKGKNSSRSESQSQSANTSKNFAENYGNSANSSVGQSSSGGSSTQNSQSGNKAYDFISSLFGDMAGAGQDFNDQIANLLGLNGTAGRDEAQDNFRATPGYDFLQKEGAKAVNNNYAGRGVLQSGAAQKALQDRALGIADQTYNSYFDRLMGQQQNALGAGQLISGAGNFSNSRGSSVNSAQSQQRSDGTSYNYGKSEGSSDGWSVGNSLAVSNGKNSSGSGLFGQLFSMF